MATVGILDLQRRADEIVRRLRDEHETIELTYLGETVGKIVPVSSELHQRDLDESLRGWHELIEQIAEHRVDDVSAEETMREIRREL